jgi:beta-galactosidase
VITTNTFGKGRAIYIGLPARSEMISPLIDDLIKELSIKKGPDVPEGIMARQIDKNHFLYLNVSNLPKEIKMKGNSKSILFNKEYTGNIIVAPYEPDFIELK